MDGARVEHTRQGGGLRVYLDRPWFSSGDGELLGVVLMREQKEFSKPRVIPDHMKSYLSQCGNDPVWLSGAPTTFLQPSHFPLAKGDSDNPTLAEIPDNKDLNRKVAVAAYPVTWDPNRKLWFCDIEIDPEFAYNPFVRLALARYQPDSIPDAHISPVVLADFAQLAPHRTASVTRIQEDTIGVVVSGIYPNPTPPATGTAIRSSRISCGENSIRVGVRVEVPDEKIFDAKSNSELGWITAPNTDYVWLWPRILPNSEVHWTGTVTLPPDRGTHPMRLSIEEFEEIPCDPSPGFVIGRPKARRIVFADRFPL